MNFLRTPISLVLLAVAAIAFSQGAPAVPPAANPTLQTPASTAVPPAQMSTDQLTAELKTLHDQEKIYNKDLVDMNKGKGRVRADGLTKEGVTTKLDELRSRDEALSIELRHRSDDLNLKKSIDDANTEGIAVQISSIAHYRGMRNFQLSGVGLVMGLEGTGDSTKSVITQTLYANWLKAFSNATPPAQVAAKNIAAVQVTAILPAYTKPGSNIDIIVSSIGDAKSLQGGTLMLTNLYGPVDHDTVIATADGSLSIGGFNVTASGSKVQRNHVNVGRIPGGGNVQNRIDSQVVFQDAGAQKLYLDLDAPNPTTVSRMVTAIAAKYPELSPIAVDSTTVSITVPAGASAETTMSKIDQTTVFADTPALIIINERTGTIVVGGNVTIGPAMIVSGNLKIRIDTDNSVSQPGPFSGGTTTAVSNSTITADQDGSKIALIRPTTKIWDLAKLFQALNLQPNDVIQILQALKAQGALKARIETQ